VRQRCTGSRDQAHRQGKRNPEVCQDTMKMSAMQWLTMFDREDDTKWPQKNKDGRQELEIRLGSEHISFEVRNTQLDDLGQH
jgi:hypothetical protein